MDTSLRKSMLSILSEISLGNDDLQVMNDRAEQVDMENKDPRLFTLIERLGYHFDAMSQKAKETYVLVLELQEKLEALGIDMDELLIEENKVEEDLPDSDNSGPEVEVIEMVIEEITWK